MMREGAVVTTAEVLDRMNAVVGLVALDDSLLLVRYLDTREWLCLEGCCDTDDKDWWNIEEARESLGKAMPIPLSTK